MKKRIVDTFKFLLFALVFYFLLRILIKNWDGFVLNVRSAKFLYLLLSVLLLGISFVYQSFVWYFSLRILTTHLSFGKVLRINAVSSLLRYLPGGIGDHLGRYALLTKENVDGKRIVVSISLLLAGNITAGVLLFLLFYASFQLPSVVMNIKWLMLVFIFLIFLFFFFSPWIINKFIKGAEIGYTHIFILLCLSVIFWLIWGTGVFFTVKAFHKLSCSLIPPITSIGAMSWIIGFLTPFAPNGAGVREIALIFFLKEIVPYSVAITSALFFRGVIIITDLILGVIVIVLRKKG